MSALPGRTLRIIGPYCQGFCCWDAIGHGLPQERSSPAKFDFGSVDQSSSKSPWQGAALLDRYFFAWSMEISRGRDSGTAKKTVESRRIDRRVEKLGWGGCFTVKNESQVSQTLFATRRQNHRIALRSNHRADCPPISPGLSGKTPARAILRLREQQTINVFNNTSSISKCNTSG